MDKSMNMSTDAGMDGRWMTYAELAELRGIDKPSALKLALRRKWPRRKDNHGTMQVCVPPEWEHARDRSMNKGVDASMDMSRAINALEARAEAADKRAEAAEKRADQAEARADRAEQGREGERARADALRDRVEALEAKGAASDVQASELTAQLKQAQTAAAELRQAEAEWRARGRWGRLRAAWRGE